jgi:hypoxanthine phosphoribosyltransferase
MTVSSYHGSMVSTGNVKIIMDLKIDIYGKDVLLVEDIIDSGVTLEKVIKNLSGRNPKSLKVLTLLNKKISRKSNIKVDQYGFEAPDAFLVGFGLDVKNKLRNLPYIGEFDETKIDEV